MSSEHIYLGKEESRGIMKREFGFQENVKFGHLQSCEAD